MKDKGGQKNPPTFNWKCQLKTVANFFKSPTVAEATIHYPHVSQFMWWVILTKNLLKDKGPIKEKDCREFLASPCDSLSL